MRKHDLCDEASALSLWADMYDGNQPGEDWSTEWESKIHERHLRIVRLAAEIQSLKLVVKLLGPKSGGKTHYYVVGTQQDDTFRSFSHTA
jgi:hypothetical protein